jgi:hypothetical protein
MLAAARLAPCRRCGPLLLLAARRRRQRRTTPRGGAFAADDDAAAAAGAGDAAPPAAAAAAEASDARDDPYGRAALRLEEVLAAAQDSNAGFLSLEEHDPPTLPGAPPPIRGLRLLPPDERLAAASQLATVVSGTSLLISWACGADPLGGASLSQGSLQALGLGALAAAPLLALALLGRTPAARRAFPTLAALQADTRDTLRPLVRGLTPPQVLVMAGWMTLPTCLALLPTARGVVAAARAAVGACLLASPAAASSAASGGGALSASPLVAALDALPAGGAATATAAAASAVAAAVVNGGVGGVGGGGTSAAAEAAAAVAAAEGIVEAADLSLWSGAASDALGSAADAGVGLLPALLASYFAASAVAAALSPRARQLAAVRDAARSAERWFRLQRAHEAGTTATTSAPTVAADQDNDGRAFRALALEWARERRSVARLAFVLSAVELLYVHELWDATGDVSAALGALTAAWACELALAARDGGGGGGGGEEEQRAGQ